MSFTPYIFFDGNCSDAIDFYAEVFGADNVIKMPYSDAPPDAGLPPSENRFMHAQIDVGNTTLMCSDNPEGMPSMPQSGFAVAHEAETFEAAENIYANLLEGGEVTMPFEPTFFSQGFGMLKDKFGTHWMVMVADTA